MLHPTCRQCLSLIYFLPVIVWILFTFVNKTYPLQEYSLVVFFIVSVLLILSAFAVLIISSVGAVNCLRTNSAHKLPCILLLIAAAVIFVITLVISIAGNSVLSAEGLRVCSLMLFHSSLIASPLYCFTVFAADSKFPAKISGISFGVAGIAMTYFYYGIYIGAQAYDTSLYLIKDVWYYSTDAVILGCGLWAVLGLISGVLMKVSVTAKNKS